MEPLGKTIEHIDKFSIVKIMKIFFKQIKNELEL